MIRINISKQIFVGKINKVEKVGIVGIVSPEDYQVFNSITIAIEGYVNE